MKRRQEIHIFWSAQENLLQQYRVMAITLLGLISAGILVLISFILGNDTENHWSTDRYLTSAILLLMYLALWGLGMSGTHMFRNITKERAHLVTFYQNLLLADESGKLDEWLDRVGAQGRPIPLGYIHRRINKRKFLAADLPIEGGVEFDIEEFAEHFSLRNHLVGAWMFRHYIARFFWLTSFSSSFIYSSR